MVQWGKPEVREFMKGHPEVVERVTQRYLKLQQMDTEELADLAEGYGLKLDKVRWELIKAIVKAEAQ